MDHSLNRENYDDAWLTPDKPVQEYTKFSHRPIKEKAGRKHITRPLTEAVLDHHVTPGAVEGALKRLGFKKAVAFMKERLPSDQKTRTGNFGEVVASEHLRQKHGYEMPIFKLRYMEHYNMPMRGEDLVAFRLNKKRVILALCVGEAKTFQRFRSEEVQDAHSRLHKAYHPHPISLFLISNILHELGDPLAEQVDIIVETLGTKPVPRENWIFIITGNRPRDPFDVIQKAKKVVENLSCVNLHLDDLANFIEGIFSTPIPKPRK